jgi:CheY-like chemotaxis protein
MSCSQILIVEDDADIRDTLQQILEIEGFTVATADNGRDALDRLLHESQPCLILLDLMMPVMNGWEFLQVLKHQHQHVLATIPIVVVSAAADLTTVQERYGCQALKKPVSIPILINLARELCERR